MNKYLAAFMFAICSLILSISTASALPYTVGNVFADVGGGIIKEFTPTGTLVQTLDTTHPGEGDGMAFDASGNLYATSGFAANTLVKFDNNGNLLNANFGSGYNQNPESIVIDNSNGFVYVGQADGSADVLKFDLNGNPLGSFSPNTQNRGTDWIDLSTDLHTLRYTSEGVGSAGRIMVFDLATNTQLPDFATLPVGAGTAYAHRILSNGGELVATSSEVVQFDSGGNVVNTYTIPNTSLLFALNLDPNGTDFWTADYYSGDVFQVNIATGTIDNQWNAGLVGGPLGGLAVFGEICDTCGPVVVPIPEPGSLALLTLGLAGLGFSRRRKT